MVNTINEVVVTELGTIMLVNVDGKPQWRECYIATTRDILGRPLSAMMRPVTFANEMLWERIGCELEIITLSSKGNDFESAECPPID
jgi:hypothetical protein